MESTAYESVQLKEVVPSNIYEQPEWTPKAKETASPRSLQKKKKSRMECIAFISIIAAANLILTLVCLVLFITHFIISQPNECQQKFSTETLLQLNSCSSRQEIQILKQKLNNTNQEMLNLLENHFVCMNKSMMEAVETTTTTTNAPTDPPPPPLGSRENPVSSCGDILQDSPPGDYWIQTNRTVVKVYCDTNRTSCSCNTTGGWMRVAYLDMTDPAQQCPAGFRLVTRTEPPFRTCRKEELRGCMSTTFPVYGIEYSEVCGRIVGYQFGSPNAFFYYSNGQNIDGYYLYGISLTHGQSPRQHIWSFVGAVGEGFTHGNRHLCPCTRNSGTEYVPPFVGSDYFCDTAVRGSSTQEGVFYPDDPLWDGQGCGSTSSCCEFNNPPWFCKKLPQPTMEDIELRLCNGDTCEDTPFEVLEILIR